MHSQPTMGRVLYTCDACGTPFSAPDKKREQKAHYCSKACQRLGSRRRVSLICVVCGMPFEIKVSHASMALTCSRNCHAVHLSRARKGLFGGEKNRQWKGGVILRDGYRFLKRPDHPMARSSGYIAEHRLVMAETLGRLLTTTEVVHHLNGDRLDNRPENLALLSASDHHVLHREHERPMKGWNHYGACRECGTTEHPHWARGLCRRCYPRLMSQEYARRARALRTQPAPCLPAEVQHVPEAGKRYSCPGCGVVFVSPETQGRRAAYCSEECRAMPHTVCVTIPCATCATPVIRKRSEIVGRVFCSRACTADAKRGEVSRRRRLAGAENPRWKGGSYTQDGYRLVWMPEHPMANRGGYIPEHRKIMADALGRMLLRDEAVHHRNGNRSDNRLENLELLSSSEHARRHRQSELRGWARYPAGCAACGTTTRRYCAKGLCTRCYARLQTRQQRAARREAMA